MHTTRLGDSLSHSHFLLPFSLHSHQSATVALLLPSLLTGLGLAGLGCHCSAPFLFYSILSLDATPHAFHPISTFVATLA
jgi:hypothetical protein